MSIMSVNILADHSWLILQSEFVLGEEWVIYNFLIRFWACMNVLRLLLMIYIGNLCYGFYLLDHSCLLQGLGSASVRKAHLTAFSEWLINCNDQPSVYSVCQTHPFHSSPQFYFSSVLMKQESQFHCNFACVEEKEQNHLKIYFMEKIWRLILVP